MKNFKLENNIETSTSKITELENDINLLNKQLKQSKNLEEKICF